MGRERDSAVGSIQALALLRNSIAPSYRMWKRHAKAIANAPDTSHSQAHVATVQSMQTVGGQRTSIRLHLHPVRLGGGGALSEAERAGGSLLD